MEADAKKTGQRVAFLKGEERKVKARTKNASKKDADVAVAMERKRNAESFSKARWNLRTAEELLRKALKQLGEVVPKTELCPPPTVHSVTVNLPPNPGRHEEGTG